MIVDDIAQRSDDVEFVSTVSARLPLWTISEMVGVPEEWHDEIRDAATRLWSAGTMRRSSVIRIR